MTTNHPFYTKLIDAAGKKGASLEAKVLLPLKASRMESRLIPLLIISKCQRDLLRSAAMSLLQL